MVNVRISDDVRSSKGLADRGVGRRRRLMARPQRPVVVLWCRWRRRERPAKVVMGEWAGRSPLRPAPKAGQLTFVIGAAGTTLSERVGAAGLLPAVSCAEASVAATSSTRSALRRRR